MWDWEGYLNLAKDLARDQQADESDYRCAASRAYYAAFHKARIWLQRNDPSVQFTGRGDDHFLVWNAYQGRSDRESRRIAQTGKRLKELRRKADYDDVVNDPAAKAQDSVDYSVEILGKLRNL